MLFKLFVDAIRAIVGLYFKSVSTTLDAKCLPFFCYSFQGLIVLNSMIGCSRFFAVFLSSSSVLGYIAPHLRYASEGLANYADSTRSLWLECMHHRAILPPQLTSPPVLLLEACQTNPCGDSQNWGQICRDPIRKRQ